MRGNQYQDARHRRLPKPQKKGTAHLHIHKLDKGCQASILRKQLPGNNGPNDPFTSGLQFNEGPFDIDGDADQLYMKAINYSRT
jgi:hypothetical protein